MPLSQILIKLILGLELLMMSKSYHTISEGGIK